MSTRFTRPLVFLAILTALQMWGCALSRTEPRMPSDSEADKAHVQQILQKHNARTPLVANTVCTAALEAVLYEITGTKYVFTEFDSEPWATGGRAAKFVPLKARFGKQRQTVTLVVNDSCRIQGLIWPE